MTVTVRVTVTVTDVKKEIPLMIILQTKTWINTKIIIADHCR